MLFLIGFAFGAFIGMLVALMVLILAVAVKAPYPTLDAIVEVSKKAIDVVTPAQRGAVIEADSEVDEARREIIEKNDQEGKDTKINELL